MEKPIKIKDDKFWHVRTNDEVIDELKSSRDGLEEHEAVKRLKELGLNKIAQEKGFQWKKVLWKNINNLIIYILFAASLISILTKEYLEFGVIIVIILITIILGFFQEYKADQSIKALSKLTAKKVEVIRHGKRKEILAEHLVQGDIVILKRGIIISADIRIIENRGLTINESILTGESMPKTKTDLPLEHQNITLGDRINIAFAGTSVTSGSGIGIVVETGIKSELGKISMSLQSIEDEKSPLQKKIDKMSKKISYIILGVAFFLFIIMKLQGYDIYAALILVGAVAVGGIPESFPLALTMALSKGIMKMAHQNAIVKDMNSVETLGTTSVICTDKTGTLTENKMRVCKIFFSSNEEIDVYGKGYEPLNIFKKDEVEINIKDISSNEEFFNCSILCNESEIEKKDNEWIVCGEPTEGSLLTLAKSTDFDDVILREKRKRVYEVAFDPSKKFMITINENKDKYNAYLKGAAEKVLEKCSFFRNSKGVIHKLTLAEKKIYLEKMEGYSAQGFRVLFLASKEFNDINSKKTIKSKSDGIADLLNDGFVFEGLVAIEDPIRADVYGAVKECQDAGVRIIMITGDYKTTASHIGSKLGLFTPNIKYVLEGNQIDTMTDDELDDYIENVAIFSRATPEHKLRIVSSLQRKGEIVAMTGDGVNDAPALKRADIGVAMGKSGTQVAREASNLILTDDNFATIVKAIKEGRTIYSNIRRFIYYLLAVNFTEVSLIVVAVMLNIVPPLTALMILFINIITSIFPAMALSIEPTHEKVMRQKPRSPKENLLSSYILAKTFVLIPFMLLGTLGLYLWELHILGASLEKAITIAFATIVMFELFHTFNARKLHTTIFDNTFFTNKYVFVSIVVSFTALLWVIYTGLGQMLFNTVALGFNDWLVIILVSSSVVIFSEIIKLSIKAEFAEQRALQGVNLRLE